MGEDLFLLTSNHCSKLVEIKDNSISEKKNKDIIIGERTILVAKITNTILQITRSVINYCGKTQIMLPEKVNHACSSGNFIAVASEFIIYIYKNFELVRQFQFEQEILSITEKNQIVTLAIKNDGLKQIKLIELIMTSYQFYFPIIPTIYYSFSDYEITGTDSQIYIKKNGALLKSYNGVIVRGSLVKESINNTQIFLEGVEQSYILCLPNLSLEPVDYFDCICLYNSIFLGLCGEFCEIGELNQEIIETNYNLGINAKNLLPSYYGVYAFTENKIISYSSQFEEKSQIVIEGLGIVGGSGFLGKKLIFSSTIEGKYYIHFINFTTMQIEKSQETEELLISLVEQCNYYILSFLFKVAILDKDFQTLIEIKFQNLEYEELSKKLDSADILAIADLKINDPLQSLVSFHFINTGRTQVEKLEMQGREFVCVTTTCMYWGIITGNSYHIHVFQVRII